MNGETNREGLRELVKDAVKLAIVRHDLLDSVDDTISGAEEIAKKIEKGDGV